MTKRDLLHSIDYVNGRLVVVLDFWGSMVTLSIVLSDDVMRKIADGVEG